MSQRWYDISVIAWYRLLQRSHNKLVVWPLFSLAYKHVYECWKSNERITHSAAPLTLWRVLYIIISNKARRVKQLVKLPMITTRGWTQCYRYWNDEATIVGSLSWCLSMAITDTDGKDESLVVLFKPGNTSPDIAPDSSYRVAENNYAIQPAVRKWSSSNRSQTSAPPVRWRF